LNFLVIVCDTLRRDHLGCYGGRVGTPHMDALAAESVVFDEAYSGSFPTLPCRAEMFTGRIIFPYLDWGPLPKEEVLLSEVMGRAGYRSALVTDNLPLCRDGYGYERGFDERVRVRGQWYDRHRPVEGDRPWPAPAEKIGEHGRVQQYLHNVAERRAEEDYFAPQTVEAACRWLEEHGRKGPFLLWADIFDPHEPWDPPAKYLDQDAESLSWIVYPRFGEADRYTPQELESIRALYRGEVRMVDVWVGRLLARLDELGLRDDTCVILLSDHGMFFGEHNLLGKASKLGTDLRGWPPYVEVSRIPMMLRVPGQAPRRTNALVHPGDLTTTILELAGIERPDTMRTRSLAPVLRGDEPGSRRVAVSSWSMRGWRTTRPSVVRDHEWSLVFWRTGVPPELYHRTTDPGETRNVIGERNYWPRRWFVSWGSSDAWQGATQSKRAA
jgi:arylsulfatase A-like enzyme